MFNYLKHYPKDKLSIREDYIEDTNKSRTLTKLRINNTMGPVEENHDGGKCPKCNEANIVNMAVHIIINCKPINGARTDETKHFRIRKKLNGTSETDIAKIIVADKSEENMKQPEQIFYQWKQ